MTSVSNHSSPLNPSEADEVISHLGGFADDEDCHTAAADREEIVGLTKPSWRSATVCFTL